MVKKNTLEARRAELARAVEAEAREEQRHGAAVELVAKLAHEIRELDPDADEKTFGQLVAARDAARGRSEALQERLDRATATVKAASAALEEAERGEKSERIAAIDRELRQLDGEVRGDAAAFLDEIHVKIARARRLAGEANLLEVQLGRETLSRARGCVLPTVPAGPQALRHVASMLPVGPVGSDPLAGLSEVA